jgi:Na+-transporting methylmalonyl-CoA/oxaloacetate decarboxylase gamma subunit
MNLIVVCLVLLVLLIVVIVCLGWLMGSTPIVEARELATETAAVLKHHQLTKHGDGVIEADLIEAVLASIRAGSAA